ncbi:MAG: hypothetical protein JWO38_7489 [Gemmataceae bacterium]|nr:hypothetical protein [Gemmataceae bacterium]
MAEGDPRVGTNTAWWIAEYATDTATWDGDPAVYLEQAVGYVDGMFGGGKAHLRPVFEKLVADRVVRLSS